MPTFQWKGKNRYGDVVGGVRVARSVEDLSRTLQREQIQVMDISSKRKTIQIPFLQRQKVRLKDLAIYSRQLSVLIDAELPLIQSLNILAEQTKNKYFKRVIKDIRGDVEAGSTLNQAKRKFPTVFDDLYCNLVASGEQSGSLDIMLRRLAEFLEKIVKLRSQVRQAMIYPTAVLSFAVVVVIFMLWKVIPVFASIFLELGAQLPFLTALVVGLSNFVQKYILFLALGFVAAVFAFRYWRKTESGRPIVDRFLLKMPLFGKLLEKVGLSRVTRTMSTLLSGGVPMLESLKITSSTAGNVIIEDYIMQARTMVAEGTSLRDALKEKGRFPFMMIQMVGVGEATGTLDEMLSKLADFYDEEVETSVASLLSIMEPILLILVGLIVGAIVVSMYLPIFDLMEKF
ncbi:MAG: type II secretion system F family protein [Candidatus Aminicenantes bacterium]|nr:type II secretion system F family protein [Candidatus Aminicenantes bacterium]MDH5383145.1 type II secretion system F family protein [Candidatus Aminicenantes bacterium]MDH5742193.1 type II secretion system F family protein [Candidatus Aminicenantes bacterium]